MIKKQDHGAGVVWIMCLDGRPLLDFVDKTMHACVAKYIDHLNLRAAVDSRIAATNMDYATGYEYFWSQIRSDASREAGGKLEPMRFSIRELLEINTVVSDD